MGVLTRMTVVALVGLALTGPAPAVRADPVVVETHEVVLELVERDPVAAGSLYACIFRMRGQGLSIAQILDRCQTELPALTTNKEISTTMPGYVGPVGGGGSSWGGGDASCPGSLLGPSARGQVYDSEVPANPAVKGDVKRGYSWGGSGIGRYADGKAFVYQGLSEHESERLKLKAMNDYADAYSAWEAAWDEYGAASTNLTQAQQGGDATKIAEAEARMKKAGEAIDKTQKEREDKKKDADADPNKKPWESARPDPNAPRVCGGDALATLRECDRNGWTTPLCQELFAEQHYCADPALMMPNPLDGTVACGDPLPPENAAEILAVWCRAHYRPEPGEDPCSIAPAPIDPTGSRFAMTALVWRTEDGSPTVCGSPLALVSEDSCTVKLTVSDVGTPDLHTILLVALDRLGGPVFVLPDDPPPGFPPRDPRDPAR